MFVSEEDKKRLEQEFREKEVLKFVWISIGFVFTWLVLIFLYLTNHPNFIGMGVIVFIVMILVAWYHLFLEIYAGKEGAEEHRKWVRQNKFEKFLEIKDVSNKWKIK